MYAVLAALITLSMFAMMGCSDDPGNKPTTYTVTFNSNGGSSVASIPGIKSGDKITAPADPTKAGNTFGGWYKEEALTTAWNFATDTVTSSITLYAKWTANVPGTYTVTFNSNGGTPVTAIPNVTSGTTITKPADPTKDDFEFGGWYKQDTLTTAWNFTTDTVTSNITLYAKWNEKSDVTYYDVTFSVDGGSAVTAQRVASGGKVTKPADPTKADNTFVDWYKEAAFTTVWNFTSDTVSANTTLYAKWAPTSTGGGGPHDPGSFKDKVEWVALVNSVFVPYVFELPDGYAWEDYMGITADYKVEAYYMNKQVRNIRLLGNYKESDFGYVVGDGAANLDKEYFIASYNSGKNAPYIIHEGPSYVDIDNNGIKELLTADSGSIVADSWFTLQYNITGSATTAHSGFLQENNPGVKDKGPFIFALGISGNGTPNGFVQQIRNVTLVGYTGAPSVIGYPLYIKSTVTQEMVPAFTGYPSSSGADGVNEMYRGLTKPAIDNGEPPAKAATTDLVILDVDAGDTAIRNVTAFATGDSYKTRDELKIAIDFATDDPDFNISSYAKFTIEATFYETDGTTTIPSANGLAMVKFVTDTTQDNPYGATLVSVYNLNAETIDKAIPDAVLMKASTCTGIVIENDVFGPTKPVAYIEITKIIFHAAQ